MQPIERARDESMRVDFERCRCKSSCLTGASILRSSVTIVCIGVCTQRPANRDLGFSNTDGLESAWAATWPTEMVTFWISDERCGFIGLNAINQWVGLENASGASKMTV